MIVKNQMLRVEQELGMKVENQFKVHYLMVIPFFAIAFLLFVIFVRSDTITHYVHRTQKKEAILYLKKVCQNEKDEYYERKYEEIRKNGFFWRGKPVVVESEKKLQKEQMKKLDQKI
jgi:hypothetical protein